MEVKQLCTQQVGGAVKRHGAGGQTVKPGRLTRASRWLGKEFKDLLCEFGQTAIQRVHLAPPHLRLGGTLTMSAWPGVNPPKNDTLLGFTAFGHSMPLFEHQVSVVGTVMSSA